MHNSYWKCNHVTKKGLSMDIDTRTCNMISEGNNIFPRSLSVNLKEASGIFLITLWWANKLAQIYTRSYTYITSKVKGSHHFRAQINPKNIFYEKTIFSEKYIFHVPLHSFQGVKVDSGPKLTLGQSNKR